MAFVIADRVRETTTTTGTGAVTLSGAYVSFQSFSAAVGNGNSTYYTISSAASGEWEVGIGTYTSSSNTLSRDTVLASSNAGSLVNFTTGSKDVFVTQPAERSLLVQSAGSGLFSGVAAFTANGVPYANSTSTLATGSGLTFDGTTLTASNISSGGTWTFSGGTANGVGYLNGSKQFTTGSALTFDGTNLGVGGTAGIGLPVEITGATSGVAFKTSASNFTYGAIYTTTSLMSVQAGQSGTGAYVPMAFSVSGSEQMRLTSTGLGIGTSSPAYKLDVAGSIAARFANPDVAGIVLQATTGTNAAAMKFANTGGNGYVGLDSSVGNRIGGGAYSLNIWHEAAYPIAFGTNNLLRMTLDSSGNLGLGVTPSGWSGFKALQINNGGFASYLSGANTQTGVFSNAYLDGASYRYIATTVATAFNQDNGVFKWYTAPSGTAGNAITFTQAMTLDASGNLGIGAATSPSSPLHVYAGASQNQLRLQASGTSAYYQFGRDSTNGYLYFYGSQTGANGYVFTGADGERARIDSSGNISVGTTTTYPGAGNSTIGASINGVGSLTASRDANNALYLNRNTSDGDLAFFCRQGVNVGTISITGSATAYNTSSDYRLKDNQQPLTGSGAFIDALQPKTWEWKADGSKGVGFIAHEVQAISPGSVVGVKDAVDEDGKPKYQAMEYGSAEFIANIVAELQSLRKRVAQLEGK